MVSRKKCRPGLFRTRMKDITINRIGLPTNSISTGYQNCVVFINGEYWGMYGAREEMDEYFCATILV